MDIHLKGSKMSMVPLVCGTYSYHRSNNTSKLTCNIMHDKKENTCLLIDTAIPNSHVNGKENDKLSKYKDLETAVSRM